MDGEIGFTWPLTTFTTNPPYPHRISQCGGTPHPAVCYNTLTMHYLLTFTLFLSAIVFLPTLTHAQVTPDDPGNFITTWDTENPGSSNSDQITIPGTGGGYNYAVYWESLTDSNATGTVATTTANTLTITFPVPGQYEVQIAGEFPRIIFLIGGDKEKILTVEQWGSIAWTSMDGAFSGCSNLRVPATDAPDLSGVSSMRYMFVNADSFNEDINHWIVSNVTDMGYLFQGTALFNQPLDNWNTSNVTDMGGMFYQTESFNQPINTWDTSSNTNMFQMFNSAQAFNQPLNNWDVSRVTDMRVVFASARVFNQPLNDWNTASATNMFGLFAQATSFDQRLDGWDISNVTDMTLLFENLTFSPQNLDSTLSSWATQATTNTIENIPLHLGLKTYSETGATALYTLRGLGWTITEQYQASYTPGTNATLIGTGTQSPLNSGDTTDSVEVRPDNRCNFTSWSDGNTDNPRSDTVTDNLTVEAVVTCSSPSSGTSARTQAKKATEYGNDTQADLITERFLKDDTTSSSTPPETLEESLKEVERLPDTIDRIKASNPTPETIRTLITLLLELVQALTLLLVEGEGVPS